MHYTPYNLTHLQLEIKRMLDQADSDGRGSARKSGGGMFTPAVDVQEDAEAYIVHLEVPGVPEENLSITLQENALVIHGTKEQKAEPTQVQYRRVERSYGAFARSLELPRNIVAEQVTAHLEDGVLEIRLPKQATVRPRQISIGSTR